MTEDAPARQPAFGRPVVVDDGWSISVSLFQDDREVSALGLTPYQAIGIAGDLIAAARRRLGQEPPA